MKTADEDEDSFMPDAPTAKRARRAPQQSRAQATNYTDTTAPQPTGNATLGVELKT